ncbi:hypothetical protein TTHERM_01094890 (macronuclear) [Tetrahymena thermophila SB210]|uniref:Uncharacterized protein n=1 Tax=Tetrahymena thermophila (strain SB210) TaxID=312017 RepID=Q22ZH1_TETTS|nr:hypothetical protein TTHERM_01094890 [Tetrahymena thermophila SB210]6YNW_d Chain d, subunit delta [Tetrahymena thermophila]6YNY_d1 Chain d1, subunit delta [Tetrahymena thermophila]6YNY_d2 Chain d2, subunit delta [Tetrahymena thermophila]6YNZ_d1 Chain d1, subunit delta [Tetrahymena thermophila]6YNZ_d2 Chain d2, subunit delta [Tetrahymena thermophila]6YNZ_d4 Chain d4, subunit delta [Tetrahymena thermophila]6YNZ_d5 Chain d5, subunit delta [Tetrahymena thermophila]EAR90676.2 hypothetical pro|eukprot:XP_001010921.2 hypothetical protein TTHERM_01094890 [Tetrahymena thermophila SB210]
MFTRFVTQPTLLTQTQRALFSALTKKQKMEVTLRTPYKEYLANFDGFSRITAKTNEASLVIQNKTPASLYVLPPGPLKIRFTSEVKNVSGDFLHTGGWVIVHADNTCEINVMDLFDRKEVRADQFEKGNIQDLDTLAGKYAAKSRKSTVRLFTKATTQ